MVKILKQQRALSALKFTGKRSMVYNSDGKPWTKETAYDVGFLSRLERLDALPQSSRDTDTVGFIAYCPTELREQGCEVAARLRFSFIDGWRDAANA